MKAPQRLKVLDALTCSIIDAYFDTNDDDKESVQYNFDGDWLVIKVHKRHCDFTILED